MNTESLVALAVALFQSLAGIASGWLLANIRYHARLRRLKIETWREASQQYHHLIERASAANPRARKLP